MPENHRDLPARRGTARTRWVPVADLSPMARALLSDDLGGRDAVPGHVADRVTERAADWLAHGFTDQNVRPWQDLPPAAAAYLAEREVDPRVLDLPVEAFPGAAPVALRVAITSERIPVERAYELLVLTGEHRPTTWPTEVRLAEVRLTGPAETAPAQTGHEQAPPSTPRAVRPVAPVMFSHARVEQPQARPRHRPEPVEPNEDARDR